MRLEAKTNNLLFTANVLSLSILTTYEIAFLRIQQNIFKDVPWEHEAYIYNGLKEIQLLYSDKSNGIKFEEVQPWIQIDGGDIAGGNGALLYREQHDIVQPVYDHLPATSVVGQAVTLMTANFINNAVGFYDINPVADHIFNPAEVNILEFQPRWRWIDQTLRPEWIKLKEDVQKREVDAPIGSTVRP